MISESNIRKYCKEYWKIENYEQAINDKVNTWVCHHRWEFTLDGEYAHSCEDLIRMDMYYDRPYFELIFIKQTDHKKLHGQQMSKHTRDKIANKLKGRTYSEEIIMKYKLAQKGKTRSDFGNKFKEHYGITKIDNTALYKKESAYYHSHNKTCRWEV